MKDYNDFFDEMIDVDDEAEDEEEELLDEEEAEFDDEDDEEGADDDSAVVRTVLLHKNDMLALLSLKSSPEGGQIVRFDPRATLPSMQRYESEDEAVKWFRRSLATSRKNGWAVVYDGAPLVG
ncbi:MAG: hypothetical protein QOJ76_2734 [Acidobacteriota bacterium]|jgi:hypothetical protein|nr:hypothetical protein [Acidobacteriota bacterium]